MSSDEDSSNSSSSSDDNVVMNLEGVEVEREYDGPNQKQKGKTTGGFRRKTAYRTPAAPPVPDEDVLMPIVIEKGKKGAKKKRTRKEEEEEEQEQEKEISPSLEKNEEQEQEGESEPKKRKEKRAVGQRLKTVPVYRTKLNKDRARRRMQKQQQQQQEGGEEQQSSVSRTRQARPGEVAGREAKFLQSHNGIYLAHEPVRRQMKDALDKILPSIYEDAAFISANLRRRGRPAPQSICRENFSDNWKISPEGVELVRAGIQAHLEDIAKVSTRLRDHARRDTVFARDVVEAKRLLEEFAGFSGSVN